MRRRCTVAIDHGEVCINLAGALERVREVTFGLYDQFRDLEERVERYTP